MIKKIVTSAGIAIALIQGLTPTALSKNNGQDDVVTKLCLAGFNAAMTHAGKKPPAGMGQYTCECFLEEVNEGASISDAQGTCKTRAEQHFKL